MNRSLDRSIFNKKRCLHLLFIFVFVAAFSFPVYASQVITGQFQNTDGSNIDNVRVASTLNDYANILSPDTEKIIIDQLSDISQQGSFNMVIVTIDGLEGHDINTVTNKIVDNNFKDLSDNIVLFVFSKSDRKYSFYLGKEVSQKISAKSIENIGRNSAFLFFNKGDYAQGIIEILTEMKRLEVGDLIFLETGADSIKSELGLTAIDMLKKGFFIFLLLIFSVIIVSGFVSGRKNSLRKENQVVPANTDEEYFRAANYASSLFNREYQRNGIPGNGILGNDISRNGMSGNGIPENPGNQKI